MRNVAPIPTQAQPRATLKVCARNFLPLSWALVALSILLLCAAGTEATAQSTSFEPLAGDMSDFDPHEQVFPTSGDTIKVGVFQPFTGPFTFTGQWWWACIGWAVHDINAQGGIWVDGKRKKIQLIRGDHQFKPAVAKRVIERLCLEDEVDFIMGSTGSHINLIGQQAAAKYRTIYVNHAALSDALMNEENFNRYTFRTCPKNTMNAGALAHFYARRPEERFYILCQDYVYGHNFGQVFRKTLLLQKPGARIVGEDYHPLNAKDYAPYLEKVRGFGGEVIVTADFSPDMDNLLKQSRQLGMWIPMAGPFVDNPNPLKVIGGPAGAGIVVVTGFDMTNAEAKQFGKTWNTQWKEWERSPYDSDVFKWPGNIGAVTTMATYWLFHVIEQAGSTDPERVIDAFEGSEYEIFGHRMRMRARDHQVIMDMFAGELTFPNRWFDNCAGIGPVTKIPAELVMQSESLGVTPAPQPSREDRPASPAVSMYVSQAIHGLTYGMLLFLVASGLTLIFGMMGVLNIAHASFFMLAGYLSYQVSSLTGSFWLALLLAPIAVGLMGISMERFLLRRVQATGLGHVGELLLTVGIVLVISEAVKVFWGTESLAIAIPHSLSGMVSLAGLQYPVYRLFIVGLSLVVLLLLALILFTTRLGTIVRAVVSDADMVSALGINVPRVSMLVFGIGTWMAGVAGVAAAPMLTVFPGMADQMGLDAFVVVVVGGLGSLPGAFVVSLILGELNAFGIQFIPRLAPVLMFAFMAIVLSLRPMGFFGERK